MPRGVFKRKTKEEKMAEKEAVVPQPTPEQPTVEAPKIENVVPETAPEGNSVIPGDGGTVTPVTPS